MTTTTKNHVWTKDDFKELSELIKSSKTKKDAFIAFGEKHGLSVGSVSQNWYNRQKSAKKSMAVSAPKQRVIKKSVPGKSGHDFKTMTEGELFSMYEGVRAEAKRRYDANATLEPML